MVNHKNPLIKKSIRVAIVFSLAISFLLVIQLINGKYKDHIWLVFLWGGLLMIPMFGLLIDLYLSRDTSSIKRITPPELSVVYSLTIILFILYLATLLFIIPLAWTISGIGYKTIFYGTMVITLFAEAYLFYLTKYRKLIPGESSYKKFGEDIIDIDDTTDQGIVDKPEFQKVLSDAKIFVGKGKTKAAIESLESFYTRHHLEIPDEITLLKNRFLNLRSQLETGLIKNDDANVDFNQINKALLKLLRKLRQSKRSR